MKLIQREQIDLVYLSKTLRYYSSVYRWFAFFQRRPIWVFFYVFLFQEFSERTSQPITFTLEERNSGWQKIDLTETVREWLTESNKKESLRLFVDCSCCSNWHVHVFNGGGGGNQDPNRPFLVIYTDPNTAKRVRRRALDCSLNLGNQCCKQRFYVSFEQLGWDDWIIAPTG